MYDEYKAYFAKVAQEATAKADIFVLAQTSATIAGADDYEEFDFDVARRLLFLELHSASTRIENRSSKERDWNCGSVSWSAK